MHVLLVEDRAVDRELIKEALEQRGARVTLAASDTEAYSLLQTDKLGRLDGLLTDIDLGLGTTGFDVARVARADRPDLPVVYITGFGLRTEGHTVEGSLTLRKPLQLSELVEPVLAFYKGDAEGEVRRRRGGDTGGASAPAGE
jgi:CheY-like chemotaxis protein